MDPATCNVGRATPHNNLTSLTSPTTLPHLRGGVKRHSFTHVATSHMHPHFSNASIPSQPSHFPTHSTATISASAKSQDHPPERSAHFPSSRRLATTCSSLQHREHAQQRGYAMQHTSHHLQRVTPVAVQSFLIWCPWLAEPWASVLLRGGCGGVRTASGAHGCDLKSQGGDQVVALRQYQSNSSHQSTSPHVRVADV